MSGCVRVGVLVCMPACGRECECLCMCVCVYLRM